MRVWRILERDAADRVLSAPELPLLRQLAAEVGGAEGFLRTALCLDIFAERGLLTLERGGGSLTLRLTAGGKKVELEDCPYLRQLRDILTKPGK